MAGSKSLAAALVRLRDRIVLLKTEECSRERTAASRGSLGEGCREKHADTEGWRSRGEPPLNSQ